MRTIARILADREERFSVLSLLDTDGNCLSGAPMVAPICCCGNKWKFCASAFRLARNGVAGITIVGHVALLPIAWALWKMGLIERYALVLHGIEAWRRLPWISRMAAQNAAAVIATTQYTLREFCFHNGVDARNCSVIPLACGFDPAPTKRSNPAGGLKIVSIGRLSASDAYKGFDTVLRALRRGSETGLNLTLDLIGSGDDKTRLQGLARSLGVQDLVRFRGSLPDEELRMLLGESHVFVMPSKKEGFGIVFLEAMAMGLPCIGANHGGTPEVIEHGESGFLIEYGDADQLIFYLRVLTESPGLYEKMSGSARERATETLSFDAMARGWGRVIEGLNGHVGTAESPVFLEEQQSPYVAP
jgi:glycosyltransferase involved in cell wall biosynthesis